MASFISNAVNTETCRIGKVYNKFTPIYDSWLSLSIYTETKL